MVNNPTFLILSNFNSFNSINSPPVHTLLSLQSSFIEKVIRFLSVDTKPLEKYKNKAKKKPLIIIISLMNLYLEVFSTSIAIEIFIKTLETI